MNASNPTNALRIEAPADEPIIIMTRVLPAPRTLVWKAWTEPQHVARWWGPRSIGTAKVIKLDVRPGGEWRFEQHTPSGDVYVFVGKYLEVVAPEKLVNTFGVEGIYADKTLVETHTFEEQDGNTFYTSVSRFDSIEDRDGMISRGMETGANESMDQLDRLLQELQREEENALR